MVKKVKSAAFRNGNLERSPGAIGSMRRAPVASILAGFSLGHDHQGHRRVARQADGDRADGTVGGVGRASDDDRHGLVVMRYPRYARGSRWVAVR